MWVLRWRWQDLFSLIFGGLIRWWWDGSWLGLVVICSAAILWFRCGWCLWVLMVTTKYYSCFDYGIRMILRFFYGFFSGYNKNTTQGRIFVGFFFLGMGFLVGMGYWFLYSFPNFDCKSSQNELNLYTSF